MTREEIYSQCVEKIDKTNCLLLESATGTGKTAISIRLINHLCDTVYKGREITLLLFVAKRVHKQTWKDEFEKWGGIKASKVVIECYESMHKYHGHYDIVCCDEVHHVGSDLRLDLLKSIQFGYFIGLSATIPQKLKQLFKYRYHSEIVSCDIVEAIEDDILPEPQILLFPLMLDNRNYTETWEMHPKAPGPVVYAEYKDIKKYKYKNIHAKISCTQKQMIIEFDHDIEQLKKKVNSGASGLKMVWLHLAGKRLEYLSDIKMPIIKDILRKLSHSRTITFCKSIPQAEELSKHCIHSKNAESDQVYKDFNAKKINHISTVNILNENANLVDCKYGIFCNLSSSEISIQQREGRLLRHKEPVMIIPYFAGTREEELAKEYVEGFKKVRTIHSIQEI